MSGERIISVIFSGDGEDYSEAIVAYRDGEKIVMVGGQNVTLTFQADELASLLDDAKEGTE